MILHHRPKHHMKYNAVVKRNLLNVLMGFAGLLFVATAILWARSYYFHDIVYYNTSIFSIPFPQTSVGISSNGGAIKIWLAHEVSYFNFGSNSALGWHLDSERLNSNVFSTLSFADDPPVFSARTHQTTFHSMRIPFWLLSPLSALPAVSLLIKRRQEKRRTILGACRQCGYDLRATPERCPECGTVAMQPTM
jgi:hypothetical protein